MQHEAAYMICIKIEKDFHLVWTSIVIVIYYEWFGSG